jgi:hypothetical protein
MSKGTTVPEVFIIESLEFDDEANDRYEGKIISNILHLNQKNSKYYYIRTKKELEKVIGIFGESGYRYLHLSCHGSPQSMATTLDTIPFEQLGEILKPHLRRKRLFISTCEMVNGELAKAIIPDSGCYSIIGPWEPVAFSDAAILWASFYHLIFNYESEAITREGIIKYCQRIVNLFGVPLNYFSSSRSSSSGFKLKEIRPKSSS